MATRVFDLDHNRFDRDGYLVVRGLFSHDEYDELRARVLAMLEPLTGPAEFEADVGYPGAPENREAAGGRTPRRLLHAYSRDAALRAVATDVRIGARMRELLSVRRISGVERRHVFVSQSHHNCVMTKFPGFSSATLWHQDVRYWSFDRPELVTAWLALGPEREENGALRVIPGTHRLDFDRGRLDRDLFLRTDLDENTSLIEHAQTVELDAGDVLFFHCRLFHAAGWNRTDSVKLSVVFTYHEGDNLPIPGTRSAAYPSIEVAGR